MKDSPTALCALTALAGLVASQKDTAIPGERPVKQTNYSEALLSNGLLGDNFGGIPGQNESFDYVIVGGGTAGLAIATRLAEAQNSVAVIEAGSFYELSNGNKSSIPAYGGYFIGTDPKLKNPLVDWQQWTEPMEGLDGRKIFYNQGKTFGGGSARNYLVYNRGPTGAYDKWAKEVDDDAYTYKNLLPYFQTSTTFQPPSPGDRPGNASIEPNAAPYGANGPVHVSYPNYVNGFSSWAASAFEELGLKEVSDFVSGKLIGYQYSAGTVDQKTQSRSSSETAYLREAIQNGYPLTAFQRTMAKQIMLKDGKAAGVLVDTEGVSYSLAAKKEVIISAGAFRSPQLLQASGIGPKDVLGAAGVEVVQDLQGVGQNLQDTPIFGRAQSVALATHSLIASDPEFLASQVESYVSRREGILTNIGNDFLAFEKLPPKYRDGLSNETEKALSEYPDDWPEIEWTLVDAWQGDFRDLVHEPPQDMKTYVSAVIGLTAPFSRGNVSITSKDTNIYPLVNPNYFGDKRDREVAVAAFKRQWDFFNTTAFDKIKGDTTFPTLQPDASDDDIMADIANRTSPIWHACCTNKMGKKDDPLAVVDSQARVLGVEGLRVVDASSFPFLPPLHPQATLYAYAERIADLIIKGSN